MFVALGIQHAMRMRHIVMCDLSESTIFFSHYFTNGTIFGKWVIKFKKAWICGNKMLTRCNRWYLLQILLLAQHVSSTTMPIIRSSRVLYRWLLPVVFGGLVFKLSVWCGAEGYVLQQPANRTHNPQLHTIQTTWKPKHQIPQAATTCIILSSSWWWA